MAKTIDVNPGTPIIANGSTLVFFLKAGLVYSVDCGDPNTAIYLRDTLAFSHQHHLIEMTITFKSA